jgi:hypothetical protein
VFSGMEKSNNNEHEWIFDNCTVFVAGVSFVRVKIC